MPIISVKCQCGKTAEIEERSHRRWLNKNGHDEGLYLCQSCMMKKKWKDKKYRKSQMAYRTDEWKGKLSKATKKSWNDPKFRDKITDNLVKNHEDGVYDKWIKKFNADQSIIDKRRKTYASNYHTAHYPQRCEISRKLWEDPEFRDRHRHSMKTSRKVIESIANQQKNKTSTLNEITEEVLKKLGIKYEREFMVGFNLVDFYLPEHNILLEINGDYWHTKNKKTLSHDKSKKTYIQKYTDYSLHTIWEYEFLSEHGIIGAINKMIGTKQIQAIDFQFDDVKISTIEVKKYKKFFYAYHYLKDGRAGHCVGGYLGDELIIAALFNHPHRHQNSDGNTLEMSRLCIKPGHNKKNLSSWFLARALKKLKEMVPSCHKVITFADPAIGHDGTTYKASGWKFIGETPPSYWYIDQNKNKYHKLTIWKHAQKMSMKEYEFASSRGLIRINTPSKLKFMKEIKNNLGGHDA